MALFKISKGLKANLPTTKTPGYCWFTIDDHLFYIDYEDSNGVIQRAALNAKDAETLTGASLATILNSSNLEIPTSKAVLDAIGALETVVASKANTSDLNSHINNKNNPHEVTLSQLGVTATAAELNYVDGLTSNIQTQLNEKSPILSPTFTGTPKAPTAAVGTNTTQIATTAFVATAIGNINTTSVTIREW